MATTSWSVNSDIDSEMEFVQFPDANFGTNATIAAGVTFAGGSKSFLERAILNFKTDGFPGSSSDIVSAKIVLDATVVLGVGQQIKFERCTRPADWPELEVTWNDYKDSTAWTSGGGDLTDVDRVLDSVPSSTGLYHVLGFKPLVVDAIDNRSNIFSIIMRMGSEADSGSDRGVAFRSNNATTGELPTLVIDYTTTSRRRTLSQAV